MKYLLDTHIWLSLQSDPDRLGTDLVSRLERAELVLLSAASAWEISIMQRLGKLQLPGPARTYVQDRMQRSGTSALSVELAHALDAGDLPLHHRDPFNRLLVAQSRLLSLPLITVDDQLRAYDAEFIWA